MTRDYSDESARILDGEATRWGDIFWPRLDAPLLEERCVLIARAIPPGTLAAGQTAGWVWTGMGQPTPFALIAKRQPAPSPLVRHTWKLRGTATSDDSVVSRSGLDCLTPKATMADLWDCDGDDSVVSAQLFFLLDREENPVQAPSESPRALRRAGIISQWRQLYPWATRYTS